MGREIGDARFAYSVMVNVPMAIEAFTGEGLPISPNGFSQEVERSGSREERRQSS